MFLGIDVGSISINIAVINDSREVLKDYYVRIEGEPLRKAYETLKDAIKLYPKIDGMAATGSGGKLISKILDIPFVNEIVAQTSSTSLLHPEVRTIIEIGIDPEEFSLVGRDKITPDSWYEFLCPFFRRMREKGFSRKTLFG